MPVWVFTVTVVELEPVVVVELEVLLELVLSPVFEFTSTLFWTLVLFVWFIVVFELQFSSTLLFDPSPFPEITIFPEQGELLGLGVGVAEGMGVVVGVSLGEEVGKVEAVEKVILVILAVALNWAKVALYDRTKIPKIAGKSHKNFLFMPCLVFPATSSPLPSCILL